MRLVWLFLFSLSVLVTPSEETIEAWDLSAVLSSLGHVFHRTESEVAMDRSLTRKKRDAAVIPEYTVDIEISFPDPSFASLIKQFIRNNLTLPMQLGSNDTTITNISITTECNQTGGDVQCSCEDGYSWPDTICNSYSICSTSNASNCNCIKGTSIPSQSCHINPVNIQLSLRILETFSTDFADSTSALYIKYKRDLEYQFNNAYKSLPGFQSATISDFRPGSIIADYTVVTEPVTASAIASANQALISTLSTNYTVDSVIRTVLTGYSSITVNPANIFTNDTVNLTCISSIATYNNVSWYYNKTQKISNSSYSWYTTAVVGGAVQSTLTIFRASFNDIGTYICTIDLDTSSYVVQTDLYVGSLDLAVINRAIPCNNTSQSVVQCCTQVGNPSFDLTCQTNSPIRGIAVSSATCKTYTITADPFSCSGVSPFSYTCNCSTGHGAVLMQIVQVTYTSSSVATITANSTNISEGTALMLQCKCNVAPVRNMSWYFITSSANNSIPTQYYSTNTDLTMCTSNLIIPSNTVTVEWNGTFTCLVNYGGLLASKAINVFRLAKPNQISISPINSGFTNGQMVNFSCCLDFINQYKPTGTLQISAGSAAVTTREMSVNGSCFIANYTAGVSNFTACCILTNLLGDTVTSNVMTLTYVKDPECYQINIGVGKNGSVITVSCNTKNTSLTGDLIYTCTTGSGQASWVVNDSLCVLAALNTLSNQVAALTSPGSETQVPGVLANLSSIVVSGKQSITSSVSNTLLVLSILTQIGNVAVDVQKPAMQNFLETVNVVLDVSSNETWNNLPNRVNSSSTLLQSVEIFAEKLNFNGSLTIDNNTNVQLFGSSDLTANYNASFNFSQSNHLTGEVLINNSTLSTVAAGSKVISIAYATLKDIIGNPNNSNSSSAWTLNGLVLTTTVTGNYSKSNFQIGMTFTKSNQTLNTAQCVFWNFDSNNWDATGCTPTIHGEIVSCTCTHLTSFSILMSLNPVDNIALDYISYIGLGISIVSLVICIIIEGTVWKSVTKNKTSYMRHICIVNIAVTLLMADVWFIVGAAMANTNLQACVAATFFTHLFYLCVFFWMLTMGLILFYRLMCVFHDLSKTIMMGISFFLGYGCPIIISVVTVAVTLPSKRYLQQNSLGVTSCWLNILESKAFLAFVVPALTILLVNFITLLVVIVKVLRPSVGDRPKKEEKSTLNHIAKCILILTPLLGLTWGFGIGTMSSSSVVIAGIFAALNSLQGLFILLFGCLLDKKVRDSLFSRFSISRWTSQQTKTSHLSSTEPALPRGVFNLFAKKGLYNISSAQVSSSSEMPSNSYSLLN
ncbi:adhesion G protein-coupled receptor F5-like [Pseudophryne corroboree]|uniref:adhesion G protein-coupled receptor F5-like n=1 Tax=Pseudophryne corroboree TaxID=495146 RepID=UPI003081CD77